MSLSTHDRPLGDITVVEISGGVATAYAGRSLTWLGAKVHRTGTTINIATDVDADAGSLVVDWLHEGKIPLSDLSAAIKAADVVLIDGDPGQPELERLTTLASELCGSRAHPPIVVTVTAVANADAVAPGSALTAAAWSGVSWSMGHPDREPLSLPYDLPSFQAGAHAAAAALTALLAAPADRGLRSVDVSTRDVLAYYTGMIAANFIPYERPWRREGARPPGSGGVYPASIFSCKDGFVTFMCRSQREWTALIKGMGSPSWSKNQKFSDPRTVARFHADEADGHLVPWIAQRTRQELFDFGNQNGLPIAPVRSFAEALAEPQFEHRGYFRAHPCKPEIVAPGPPWKLLARRTKTDTGVTERRLRSLNINPVGTDPRHLLQGLRVLDLSWVWSGPMVTSMLADLGAEVVKVEHFDHLDAGRMRGRARRDGREVEGPEHEVTPYFNQMNHGKRSITLDIKNPGARAVLLSLAAECDIVVENMRPGALQKLGLGYEQLSAQQPGLVMLSMSMAGQSGPLSGMKGYAGIMAAMSGLDSIIGYSSDDLIGSLTPSLGDPNAASHAMIVLMAALHRVRATGHGSWIDLSQIEALLSVTPSPLLSSQLGGQRPVLANFHSAISPHGHFRCAGVDRWVAISAAYDAQWATLCELAGADLHHLDPQRSWVTTKERLRDRESVKTALEAWTSTQDRDSLVERLISTGVAAAPVASFEDLESSAWLGHRRLYTTVTHPYLGDTKIFVLPWKFDRRAGGIPEPAPLLGSDTDDILSRLLGLSDTAIAELRRRGSLR